jgi:hypothetical protein
MNAKVVRSPRTVVDELERWVEVADIDGFNFSHVTNPGTFEDIIEFGLPEMKRRGLFDRQLRKKGATAREQFLGSPSLLDDHPGSRFKWHLDDKVPSY